MMAEEVPQKGQGIWLSIIAASGSVAAAALSGYVTYYTSTLNATISTQQAETQSKIAELQESTKRQISELESSFKRAELFTKSIKELKNSETSPLVLMGLWPLFSRPEERRVMIAAALHVGNPEVIDVLGKLGTELDPFLDNVIQEAMRSQKPGVASAAKALVTARKEEILEKLLRPIALQLERIENALRSYSSDSIEPYETIIREGNAQILSLLRDKADLIPEDLKSDSEKLLQQYDKWFQEYEKPQGGDSDSREPVFAGLSVDPFLVSVARRFEDRFCKFNTELKKYTDEDLATVRIRQVPTKESKDEDSGKQWYNLRFSAYAERASHKCILDYIERVVYVMDEKWWRPENEFAKEDRSNSFEFSARVWGITKVKAKIFIRGRDTPLLREGRMNLKEVSFLEPPARAAALPSQGPQ